MSDRHLVKQAARAAAKAMTASVQHGPTLDKATTARWSRLGQGMISERDAVTIMNSAVRDFGGAAPLMAECVAAGAVIEAVAQVVEQLCGPPKDVANPFEGLPEWAVALFKKVGLIKPPAPVVDPDAPPAPIETRAELEQRAANAGIVLG
jgi:hypothetical protein